MFWTSRLCSNTCLHCLDLRKDGAQLTEDEKRLAEMLIGIKRDKVFVLTMVTFAKEHDVVSEMADMIEECEIKDENELYDIIFDGIE